MELEKRIEEDQKRTPFGILIEFLNIHQNGESETPN